MNTYTKKDEIIDAIACISLLPMAWAIWTLLCCVSQ